MGWQTEGMARRRVTLELDGDLLDAARAAAARLGVPEEELFERTLREVLARDFDRLTDEITAYQDPRALTTGASHSSFPVWSRRRGGSAA